MSNVYVNMLNELQLHSDMAYSLLNQSKELMKQKEGPLWVQGFLLYIKSLQLIKCGIGLEIYSYIIFPDETLDEMKHSLYNIMVELDLANAMLHDLEIKFREFPTLDLLDYNRS